MKINPAQNTQNKNINSFKGIPVGKVRLNGTLAKDEITLYQVDKTDLPFLLKMIKKINLENLYPQEKDKTWFDEWKNIIFQAIEDINMDYKGLLAVRRNKPCGIMSYNDSGAPGVCSIEHLASWPIKASDGTKGSGRAMMRMFFENMIPLNKNRAFVIPSQITPRNKTCEDFYKFVGFKSTPLGNLMEISEPIPLNKNIFSIAGRHLDEYMTLKPLYAKENKNLNEILNIGYD